MCTTLLIKCMACGFPVIASPVGANLEAVPTTCGLLASSAVDWLVAIRELDADPELRAWMGAVDRRWVEERYSLRSALPVLGGMIREVAVSTP